MTRSSSQRFFPHQLFDGSKSKKHVVDSGKLQVVKQIRGARNRARDLARLLDHDHGLKSEQASVKNGSFSKLEYTSTKIYS
jgi:hypothetical protein